MEASVLIKEKLHHYIDVADENKLNAIYTLLENEIEWQYSLEDISKFNTRREKHLKGETKSFTVEESLGLVRKQKK